MNIQTTQSYITYTCLSDKNVQHTFSIQLTLVIRHQQLYKLHKDTHILHMRRLYVFLFLEQV